MNVIALVGPTGTGKSHHAVVVAKKVNAEAIIDDGLLIIGNKVAAGSSAKKEKTKIASVKRALFSDKTHAEDVKAALKKHKVKTLLILGTSREMTDRIANILGAGAISRYISIEEVSTPEDIQEARRLRNTQGKHIIPVPALEIKKDFSGYFLHPLRLFKRKFGVREEIADKSIVRPTYSYMGEYTISDNVIARIVEYEANRFEEIAKSSAEIFTDANGELSINLVLSLKYGVKIKDITSRLSHVIISKIEKTTSINVINLDFHIKELVVEEQEK